MSTFDSLWTKAALQFVHHLDLADNSSRTAKFSIDAQVPCIRFKIFNVPFQEKNHVTFHKPDVFPNTITINQSITKCTLCTKCKMHSAMPILKTLCPFLLDALQNFIKHIWPFFSRT